MHLLVFVINKLQNAQCNNKVQSKFHKTECPLQQQQFHITQKAGTSCGNCQGHDKRDNLHLQIF
jgi:hypothetical protein